MSIRIETAALVELIGDLSHTAAADPALGAIAGILLHTARGYGFPADPGKNDLLVGTSTTRFAVGHSYVTAYGQMTEPMLWPILDAAAVVNVFRPQLKDNKEHAVEIRRDGNTITVQEDPDLFGEGLKLEFNGGDVSQYPHGLWSVLSDITVSVVDDEGAVILPQPRTDFSVTAFAPFFKVAKAHGGVIETYRYHQKSAVLIQIGDRYRGAVMPVSWKYEDPQGGHGPGGGVYPTALPEGDEEEAKAP